MAEPSYFPLSPLKSPPGSSASPSPEKDKVFKTNSDDEPSYPVGTMGTADAPRPCSGMFLAHSRQQRKGGRLPFWNVIEMPLKMALFPLAAIGYLTFCYAVHDRAVPVNTYGLYDVTPEHLATIKGGITSISIIIISIALFPIYDMVSNLKSEELFRVLASRSQGVPLETIDRISTPSFGKLDMAMAMFRNTCSNHYSLGIVASLLMWIVATLAPGALTINSVLADGELMALAVGGVFPQSVLNGSSSGLPAFNASLNSVLAASIAWAEMELGVQYSFGVANTSAPEYAAYIVPFPLDLPTTTSARWLTDVIGINPTCSWASTNLTTVQVTTNSSAIGQPLATAYLPDFNLDIQITTDDESFGGSAFASVKQLVSGSVTNHTTHAPTSDGSTVFLLGQCQSGCPPDISVEIKLNLTSTGTTFTITSADETWTMAILTCLPNLAIETREVRNDGHGHLSVQPRPGHPLMVQGNLDPLQTTALFSIATMSLTQDAGHSSGTHQQYNQLGSPVQSHVLFGQAQFDGLPPDDSPSGTSVTVSPAPIEVITQGYTRVLQSAAKAYLTGYLGTAYVPGRISESEIVFASSIPNLAVSTAMFALLAALLVVAHFRSGKGIDFTLVNVAAALHGSELPAQFAQMKAGEPKADVSGPIDVEVDGYAATDDSERRPIRSEVPHDQEVADVLGGSRIFMQKRGDGSPVLHIR